MTDLRRSRFEWRALVDAYRASNLAMHEFAEIHRVRVGQLRWWASHLDHAAPSRIGSGEEPVVTFVELPARIAPVDERLELALANGRTLRFGVDLDNKRLAELITVLEGAA